MKTKFAIFLALILFLLSGQGCIIKFKKQDERPQSPDGGIYKSLDMGKTWVQSGDVLSIAGGVKLNNVDVADIIFDPQDRNTMYLLTKTGQVYLSLDAAQSWLPINTLRGAVSDIAVDPKDKCRVYAGIGNVVWRSTDCLRTFQEIFHTDTAGNKILALAVDFQNSKVLYVASSKEILKSLDGGKGWHINFRLSGVKDIFLRNVASKEIIYVVAGNSIYTSENQGKEWQSMDQTLKRFRRAQELISLSFDESAPNALLYVFTRGVLRSSDGGLTWTRVETLSDPSPITSAAIDPRNPKLIFYTTATTYYRSDDGGANWSTHPLPTIQRLIGKFVIDPRQKNVIYLTAFQPPPPPEQKKTLP